MGRVWKVLVYAWIISWRTYLAEFVCFYSKAFRCTIAEKALRCGELETRVLALPLVHPISIGSSVNPLFGRINRSGYALKKNYFVGYFPESPFKAKLSCQIAVTPTKHTVFTSLVESHCKLWNFVDYSAHSR